MALRDTYAIERQVGPGGMATVYLAEDLKHQRRVAINLLRPELTATLGTITRLGGGGEPRGCGIMPIPTFNRASVMPRMRYSGCPLKAPSDE